MSLPIYSSGITDPHVAALAIPVFGSGGLLLGACAVGPSSVSPLSSECARATIA